MKRRLRSLLVVGVALVGLVATTATAAYVGQNPYSVHLAIPLGSRSCRSSVIVTATVRSATTAALISGQAVDWDVMVAVSAGDRVIPARSVTGSNGKATTTLFFANFGGKRTVRAMVARFPATIDVTCHGPSAPPTPRPTPTPAATPTPDVTDKPTTVPTGSPTPSSTTIASSHPSPASTAVPSEAASATATPLPTQVDGSGQPASNTGPDLLLLAIAVVFVLALGGFGLALRAARR